MAWGQQEREQGVRRAWLPCRGATGELWVQRTYPQAREAGEFSVEGGQVVVADREVLLLGKASRKGLGAA